MTSPTPIVREDPSSGELSSHDRILHAARTLFANHGYENTTTSAIARTAGTSESQLIKHFGSKEGLLEEIFEQSWRLMGRNLPQLLASHKAPVDRLQALTEMMFAALERDMDLRSLMLLEGRRIRRHGQMVVLTRGYMQLVAVIDGLLRDMREAGQLRADLNLEAIRSALIGSFEGLLRDQLLAKRMGYPAGYDAEEMRAAFNAFFQCFLSGELASQPSPRDRASTA